MKTDYATLSLNRHGKGRGQRAVLKRYNKDGEVMCEYTGRKAYQCASVLRAKGVTVVMT